MTLSSDVINNGKIYFRTTGDNWYRSFAMFNNSQGKTVTNNGLLDINNAVGMSFVSSSKGSLINKGTINVNCVNEDDSSNYAIGMEIANKGLTSGQNTIENHGTINATGANAFGIRVSDGAASGTVTNYGTIDSNNGAISIAVYDNPVDSLNTHNINVNLEGNSEIDSLIVGDGNKVTFTNNSDTLAFATVDFISAQEAADAAAEKEKNTADTVTEDKASSLALVNSNITFENLDDSNLGSLFKDELSGATLSTISLDSRSTLTNKTTITVTESLDLTAGTFNNESSAVLNIGALAAQGEEDVATQQEPVSSPSFSINGGTFYNAGTLNINSGASFTTAGTATIDGNGAINFADDASGTLGGADVVINNSMDIAKTATVSVTGNVTFNGSTESSVDLTGSGTLTLSEGSTLHISDAANTLGLNYTAGENGAVGTFKADDNAASISGSSGRFHAERATCKHVDQAAPP